MPPTLVSFAILVFICEICDIINTEMLTHLKIKGFKSLENIDLYFGPFTCVAGLNAVGKSNLFDAISFLSSLADNDLTAAAAAVRDEKQGRESHLRRLFHFDGDKYATEMEFEAEMIVPREGQDDLGQPTKATHTFLRYRLVLGYRAQRESHLPPLQVMEEALDYIKTREASKRLPFDSKQKLRDSILFGARTTPYISTDKVNGIAKKTGEGKGGAPVKYALNTLSRTLLSTCNSETPTACQARNEMRSWRLLQLEPSSLRRADDFSASPKLDASGGRLAATLERLVKKNEDGVAYNEIANRLSTVVGGVRDIRIDRDDKRELLTLEMRDSSGCWHPAHSLSDGTLRVLALAILEMDDEATGVWCLEEPENGVTPQRIVPIVKLLEGIAVDAEEKIDDDNPLRQVIINTHSPIVVAEVPDDSLILMDMEDAPGKDSVINRRTMARAMTDTWRTNKRPKYANDALPMESVPRVGLTYYLSPIKFPDAGGNGRNQARKVKENPSQAELFRVRKT